MRSTALTEAGMVTGGVAASANVTDNHIGRHTAVAGGVAKTMAPVTLANQGKRGKKFGFTRSAKHEDRVFRDSSEPSLRRLCPDRDTLPLARVNGGWRP